jgi:hypothetical protein
MSQIMSDSRVIRGFTPFYIFVGSDPIPANAGYWTQTRQRFVDTATKISLSDNPAFGVDIDVAGA